MAIVRKIDKHYNVNGYDSYLYKYGYIDKTGNIAIPLQYDEARPFKEGHALVKQNGRFHFIDRLGNKVNDSYDKVGIYYRGTTWGSIHGNVDTLRWGGYKINKSLKKIYDAEIEGMTMTSLYRSRWGFINQELEQVIPEIFSSAKNFSEGLAAVETNAKWGYINREGKFVIPPRFDGAEDFKAGIAPIKIDEKWGYINMFGEVVIKAIFVEASKFESGLAKVRGDNDSFFYINLSGKKIIPFEK